ncbi:MAG: carboxymuconolactone decarboxylase [Actinomycetia bacterium]|nr:carboxymuconolactone decarboxylase [Actinomycetes bacterium]
MSVMPGTPRIKPLPENEWDTVLSAVASTTGPLNIFTTLGRHPDLFKAWIGFGSMLLLKGTLPPRDRELAILRTAHLSGCAYEWGHHVRIGGEAGLSGTEIAALAAGLDDHPWAPGDRAVVAAADELNATGTLGDATWSALAERFDERGLIELVILIGHYRMLAYGLNALRVQPEESL